MASSAPHRLRLTPSGSPFLPRPARTPLRGRALPSNDSRLSLKRVIGTTCASPTGFDVTCDSFAYIAGGAVVVVDVKEDCYNQRFFRARPTALPLYNTPPLPYSPAAPVTPKANDGRSRITLRDSPYAQGEQSDSPSSKTWTSRERIKAATCLALSKEGKFLAVGETGYAPRVLIYSLDDQSSDTPLVSISEHGFGVKAVAWSPDSRYLASLGSSNDGFLYVWRIDPRTGAAKLFQQNRCTTFIKGMVWMGNSLITLGVRHVKVWRIEETQATSPLKQKFIGDLTSSQPQKTLPGRNALLGNLIEATFSCAAVIDDNRAIICSETGDICLLDDTGKQMKLTRVLESGFLTTCVAINNDLAYISGKSGCAATIDVESFIKGSTACLQTTADISTNSGLLALGFLSEKMVTVDLKRSIDIWDHKEGSAPMTDLRSISIPIPGGGDAVSGVGSLAPSNMTGAHFYTWSRSGNVVLWTTNGVIRSSFQVPLDDAYFEDEPELTNEMTTIRATTDARFFIAGDKLGFIKIIDFTTKECVSSMKAHASDCQFITIYESPSRLFVASCGRDRTAQLFHRQSDGEFEHFQTLEFQSRVCQVLIPSDDRVVTCAMDRTIQIHDLVTKDGDSDVLAAIPSRTLSLKASPISMAMGPDAKSLFVSQVDRSVSLFDLDSGKLVTAFKCFDERGCEAVNLDSLTYRSATDKEPAFLLGLSNTDKSIRIYSAQAGQFLTREWGHTEAIQGAALIDEDEANRKVVSVGSDGTIMIWEMDLQERAWGSASRDSSPVKDATTPVSRPTLRRILSKAELAEFQRPSSAAGGRRSPPRVLSKRRSFYNLASPVNLRTPTAQSSAPTAQDTPSRRPSVVPSAHTPSGSPPVSPKSRISRRPSLPALSKSKTKSNGSLRGNGSLNTATEQTCRTLRSYRKKLASTDPVSQEVLAELDQELRLTAVALGERATRSQALSDSMLNGLLDQYSERLLSMLDEKLRLNGSYRRASDQTSDTPDKRPGSSGTGSSSNSA
ncbi:WD domain-containing protein [Xylariaceae sp. FL1019]|nr:WD domain-containing protein [Xylariaceae sp. FL1019]